MKISVLGLGRVGAVTAACLASRGHEVIGVDIDPAVADSIANGRSHLAESGLEAMIAAGVATGALTATTDPAQAIAATHLTLVCVGTPGGPDGSVELGAISAAAAQIGAALRGKAQRHQVIIRSTVPPGTTRNVLAPLLAGASGKTPGVDFGLAKGPASPISTPRPGSSSGPSMRKRPRPSWLCTSTTGRRPSWSTWRRRNWRNTSTMPGTR